MTDDNLFQIYSAGNSREASLVVKLLADGGIEARVASDSLEGVIGEVPFFLSICPVWIHEADRERAQAVMREFQSAGEGGESLPDIFCYECGAVLAEHLAECPHCGSPLDWS